MTPTRTELERAAHVARGLALDAIAGCKSGHLGLPLGAAEIGAALFGRVLRLDPQDPRWMGRDRLVLSAGHGSMFLYAWLHLAGFPISLDDVRAFRRLGSLTPGHPEFGHTPGVEITSGPLGQGVANAVGMALSGKLAGARWDAPAGLLGGRVFCLAGDGCLQEGVALEATELAGHLGLDNLTLVWDANAITLDAPAAATQSMDAAARYAACGWEVVEVDGHDVEALAAALEGSRGATRPVLLIARTRIARGISQVEGTPKGHGEGGAAHRGEAKAGLGLSDAEFQVPEETRALFSRRQEQWRQARAAWQLAWEGWTGADARELKAVASGEREAPRAALPVAEGAPATRKAGETALQELARQDPLLVSFSADLFGSNLNYIAGGGDIGPGAFTGRNLRVGIREHAMGAVMNGLAYEGLFRPLGATFLVFSDYLRPAMRLSAMAQLPVIWWFTHDSVGVGEDGPTHQPIEQTASLRLMPGLECFRPADARETAACLEAAARRPGPSALALSRQSLPDLGGSVGDVSEGVCRGAWVVLRESRDLDLVLLSSGSEVQHAMDAARQLTEEGWGVRVLSVPCVERLAALPDSEREALLPRSCRRRLAVEAGVGESWHRFTGLDGRVLSIERFGLSAPADQVMRQLGMSADAVLKAARELLED